ncbi:exodeoxyribonuclease V subunit gamma [Nocardioides donggukensis]|uniref:RecBCD enzyme subunit RecC n=1 Tax=Nocardioides donggukensis TaxID=2774019 RepID=A0A927PYZ1_9ACTN|nr:exodeoxyribonuclease V subunit gamma [Nocardioides donggukensis]MBD8868125.1 exodeoxyribonuclease V subunit gamma [Nocardioides donggukensis]
MSLHVHTADRTDRLADGLGDLLARPLADPFAREVVVVPARGIERWLTQRLAHRLGVGASAADGVCAGVDFLSPRSLVAMLLGTDRDDPWEPDCLVWPLLEVIDGALGEPGFETLSAHLGHGDPDGERSARRYAVARRLAGLFASYAVQRPTLVRDWRAGRDTDGAGGRLDDDLRWQPELWRRLLAAVGAPGPDERHATTLARLRDRGDGGEGLDLPPRLSLFGHTRLPATEVELLRALGEHRDVHLWLPQVSPTLWEQLAPTAEEGPVPRDADDSATRALAAGGHPLLASLGRDARELRRGLGPLTEGPVPEPTPTPDSMLGWLQADLRGNRVPSRDTRAGRVLREDDRSVQVHSCHGSARQVDVLREVLVGLLQDDPTLEPRDILVMCPDIESYAPLISAGFGLADVAGEGLGHPAHQLRVRLADRAPGATNPLLAVAATIVELAGGRLTATEVLDLAAAAPVRRRFGFDDDALERISRWVAEAGIRWGLDGEHRADYGLGFDANTWAAGLRRVLLGGAVAGAGHRQVAGTLPLDDVGDGDLDLAGRFAELVDRLHAFLLAVGSARTAADWTTALSEGVARLTATDPEEAWQAAQFDRELARMRAGADSGGGAVLRHPDVRALLRQRLGGRPTRSNFRTGTLTVCTMVPMRSVPHRVVCLVGLDDGVFPRVGSVDGDDVLARRPHTGERDVRAEDRQLLLDAIGAATETLVVTYTGRGEHTGAERPPSVPLGELLDALDDTAAEPVRDRLCVAHPLQPFDEAALVPGRLVGDRPFTFDRAALAGAESARGTRTEVGALVGDPLVALPAEDVSLADLHDFFAHPVRGFLRSRLGIGTPREVDEAEDAIPIDLDALERWAVGDRLVGDVLAGAAPQDGMLAEQLRGLLPPRQLGVRTLTAIARTAQPLVERGLELRRGPARTLDVDIDLGDGRRLTGTVGQVFGNDLVHVGYSNLGAKHRFATWLDALALAAGHPDENWTGHTIGKHRSGGQRAIIRPLPEDAARRWLRELVDVRDRGLCDPLPLPVKAACRWAEEYVNTRLGRDADPDARARAAWETPAFSDSGIPTEDADAWHVRAFGERAAYDSVLACPPLPGEDWNDAPHRLGRYAWRLWGPLLTDGVEQVRSL